MSERAVTFECQGTELVGILHGPEREANVGLLIVVGGPQYRVGSHRQFVLLARSLEQAGVACLRFDCRGMGDSGGGFAGFESIDADISAALDKLLEQHPNLRRVCIWGLCDAASAILMYAWKDPRVAGVVLVNPWVRSAAGQAQAVLEQYYWRRLSSRDFWQKLMSGKLGVVRAARELARNWLLARGVGGAGFRGASAPIAFQERMLQGLERFTKPVLLITSGDDLTAAEFLALVSRCARWQRALGRSNTERRHLAEANHTFSAGPWRVQVELWTLNWLAHHADGC